VTEGTWLRLDVHPVSGDIVFDMAGDVYCPPGDAYLGAVGRVGGRTEAVPVLTGVYWGGTNFNLSATRTPPIAYICECPMTISVIIAFIIRASVSARAAIRAIYLNHTMSTGTNHNHYHKVQQINHCCRLVEDCLYLPRYCHIQATASKTMRNDQLIMLSMQTLGHKAQSRQQVIITACV
jgi:hypothetical protein